MENNHDEKIIEQLNKGLDHLDQSVPVNRPSFDQFRQMVAKGEEKKRVTKNKEFILFIISAIAILGVTTCIYNIFSMLFIVIQVAAVILVPGWLISWARRERKQEGTS